MQIKNTYAKEKEPYPSPLLTHTATTLISFQKPGLTGKLSGSKVGGKDFNAKIRTAL